MLDIPATKFKIGQDVYFINRRTVHAKRTCVVCNGAKTLTVKESDRPIRCMHCSGKGVVKFYYFSQRVKKARIRSMKITTSVFQDGQAEQEVEYIILKAKDARVWIDEDALYTTRKKAEAYKAKLDRREARKLAVQIKVDA